MFSHCLLKWNSDFLPDSLSASLSLSFRSELLSSGGEEEEEEAEGKEGEERVNQDLPASSC